ncbi:MAG: terminase family protein [Verrucomicrobiota bacterium]|jgi:phage FluMu gp28-like protein
MKADNPAQLLLPYQKRWVKDDSRWKFGLWSRQTGKDYSSGFEGIREIVEAEKDGKKREWLIAAPSERQSLESLAKWKEWAIVFNQAIEGIEEVREGRNGEALLKSATITFPHGSRVIAVPGQPDTVRGYSANVLLTEFAFFEQPDATWRAILPSITNPMRGGVKKVRLITTPNGIGNKAHEIWEKNYKPQINTDEHRLGKADGNPIGKKDYRAKSSVGSKSEQIKEAPLAVLESRPTGKDGGKWSCHFVDIYSAVKDHLPVEIEELKEALNDPEGWAQEFECQFLDVQSTLLPYELITSCESQEAQENCPAEFWNATPAAPLAMGIDFGRSRDLTVAWTLMRQGNALMTVEVLALDRMPTDRQVEILSPRIRRCEHVCLDYTGAGVGMGDYLVKEFQEYNPDEHLFGKIELCQFCNALKVEIFSKLRMGFEKKEVFVPQTRNVREDLHSVNRVTTPTGQITYRAPHTADGHADRCTALALALRAGRQEAAAGCCCFIPDSRINRVLAARRDRNIYT